MSTTLIIGPMKSGKSEKLLEMIHNYHRTSLVIKPATDTRDNGKIVSRATDITHDAAMINENNEEEVYMLIAALTCEMVDTLFIDEVQFFSEGFVQEIINECAKNNVPIVASGLSHDFKGEWFPSTLLLVAEADTIHELTAICELCGCDNATENILVNGLGEKQYNGDSVLVEDDDNELEYRVICNDCNWKQFDSRKGK